MNVSFPGPEPSPPSALAGGAPEPRRAARADGLPVRVTFSDEGGGPAGAVGTLRVLRLGSADAQEARSILHERIDPQWGAAETHVVVDGPLGSACRVTEVALQFAAPDADRPPAAERSAGIAADLDVPAAPAALVAASRWTADSARLPDAPAALILDGLRRLMGYPSIAALPAGGDGIHCDAPGVTPIAGGEAGAFALAAAVLPRWAAANPARGAELAVLEACRRLAVAGYRPVALAAQIDGSGISPFHDLATRQALAVTAGKLQLPWCGTGTTADPAHSRRATPLAPVVVAVGEAPVGHLPRRPSCTGAVEALVLAGAPGAGIETSLHLELSHHQRSGPVPAADVAAELQLWRFLEEVGDAGIVRAARPLGEGGLLAAVALALVARGLDPAGRPGDPLGASLDTGALGRGRRDALLLGEQPGRVLLAVAPEDLPAVAAAAERAGVPAIELGRTSDADTLIVRRGFTSLAWRVSELARRWRDAWVPPPPRAPAPPRLP